MDYGLSEEQEMFKNWVRDFLQKEYPRTLVREIEDNKLDYSPEVYRKMTELGWMGIMIPEEYGGQGGDWVNMAVFYEEAGRFLLQSPHFTTVCICAQAILSLGTEEQKKQFLPKIASGELIATLALNEPEAGSELSLLSTTAAEKGNDYIINGTKLFIANAHFADYILTAAKTGPGITLFLVDGKSEGLTCTTLDTLSGERVDEVNYENVSVPKDYVLGEPNKGEGISDVVEKAKIMSCAEMVGGAQTVLDMAIEYSKQRVQFGVPIGSFQALQHKMADVSTAIEGAKWLVYNTAWMNSQGIPSTKQSAMAQLRAGEAYRNATAESGQILGGMGMMREHDWGLFLRRAKSLQINMGAPHKQKETIASAMGL